MANHTAGMAWGDTPQSPARPLYDRDLYSPSLLLLISRFRAGIKAFREGILGVKKCFDIESGALIARSFSTQIPSRGDPGFASAVGVRNLSPRGTNLVPAIMTWNGSEHLGE